MKKIITLLVLFGAYTAVSAQTTEDAKRVILGQKKGTQTSPSGDSKDVIFGGDRRVYDENGNRYPTTGSNGSQIDQVNREYDRKIYSIRNNPDLSTAEKERIIRQLEAERARKIKAINRQYDDRRDDRRYDDDDDRNDGKKYGKNNNPGKKLGWEKGVGNPHRSGSKNYNKGNGKSGKGNGKGKH
jgi:hypothetical protein